MRVNLVRVCLSPIIVAGSVVKASEENQQNEYKYGQDNAFMINFDRTKNVVSDKIKQAMVIANAPGACVVVHVHGKPVMKAGFGFSDVENVTKFQCNTSMRIASISKLITSMITLHQYQRSILDIDSSLTKLFQSNTLSFLYDGVEQDMTLRQLLNHTAGIRHYHNSSATDSDAEEFHSSKKYASVYDGLNMFTSDELLHTPGSDFKYTTFGYSLVSFVLENATKKTFDELLCDFTLELNLKNTQLDKYEVIIPNRCRYYFTDNGKIKNCPYVDNSCKWAGGGMVSTAEDIAVLGDILMYCYQSNNNNNYLDKERVSTMLGENEVTTSTRKDGVLRHYGLGVTVEHPLVVNGKNKQKFQFFHTGGAVGASSVLLMLPLKDSVSGNSPAGITVVLFCNHEDCSNVTRLANEIARMFAEDIESYYTSEDYFSVT